MKINIYAAHCCAIIILILTSCKKFIDADPPKDQVLAATVFNDSSSALAALLHIYTKFGLSGGTIEGYFAPYPSLYADELLPLTASPDNTQYYTNGIYTDNSINAAEWQSLYSVIYECNAVLEGVGVSGAISPALKDRFTGEAKFLRAFAYFLLVNSYGEVPLVLSTNTQQTATLARTGTAAVYTQILDDLSNATAVLSESYASGGKIRANKWAATALLAKVNLYLGNWQEAEAAAGAVIRSGLYTPLQEPSTVFIKNSNEAILQFYENYGFSWSGNYFLPFFGSISYTLTPGLLMIFDGDDKRKMQWMDSAAYDGSTIFYPSKYKNNGFTSANEGEYTMCLRAGEQYLVKAEAACNQNKTGEAVADINIIRARAGIGLITAPVSKDSCLHLIAEERRRELFTEWGNRFFDLKRTGQIDAVLGIVKPTWTSTAALYPVPQTELNYNYQLTQNPGY